MLPAIERRPPQVSAPVMSMGSSASLDAPYTPVLADATDHVQTAVIVPVRCFSGALSRLAGMLNESQRSELMRRMAARVVAAASPHPTYVATDDEAVAAWAGDVGASTISVGRSGLSATAALAVERLASAGIDRVVLAHADLALARTLDPAIGPGMVIVPDTRHDGSNVICVPSAAGFSFAYGEGSFKRHVEEARRLDMTVTVVEDPALAADIDNPDDLLALPAGELISLGLIDLVPRNS